MNFSVLKVIKILLAGVPQVIYSIISNYDLNFLRNFGRNIQLWLILIVLLRRAWSLILKIQGN
jgi:hypothetical protein